MVREVRADVLLDTGPLVVILSSNDAHHKVCAAELHKLGAQLANATLIYLAEREELDTIFTLDRRDFSVYRLSGNRSLHILPE